MYASLPFLSFVPHNRAYKFHPIMAKLTHSVGMNDQHSKVSEDINSHTGSGTYMEFFKERENLVWSLEKEASEKQKRVETLCKESSQISIENLEKAIKLAEKHFHSDLSDTGLDFIKIKTELEASLSALGQQLHLKERDMNRKHTNVVASELRKLFTKRSNELKSWQKSLKAEKYQDIEKHIKNSSREDRIDIIVNFARNMLGIPLAGFEHDLIYDNNVA